MPHPAALILLLICLTLQSLQAAALLLAGLPLLLAAGCMVLALALP